VQDWLAKRQCLNSKQEREREMKIPAGPAYLEQLISSIDKNSGEKIVFKETGDVTINLENNEIIFPIDLFRQAGKENSENLVLKLNSSDQEERILSVLNREDTLIVNLSKIKFIILSIAVLVAVFSTLFFFEGQNKEKKIFEAAPLSSFECTKFGGECE